MNYLENLNEKQKEAVLHTEGPLLILAGAGSGKTSTMTRRIAHLIKGCSVSPYNILAVTFTNKAATEMRERVEALLDGNVNMWIMTFHAACLRILRTHAESLGYTNSFVVYDPVDQKTVVKNLIKEKNLSEKQFPVKLILSIVSKLKEDSVSVEEYERLAVSPRDKVIAGLYKSYAKALKKNDAMDFDDLLANTVKLFKNNPDILAKYQDRFQYIMVDEYQDTNNIQYQFIHMLAEQFQNICVVGDDDQCIYQWRGADISNILNFEKDFVDAKVIKLEQNYRSTANILAGAHSVISRNATRKAKKLWTTADAGSKIVYSRLDDDKMEANYIAQEIDRISTQNSRLYNDFAVLYRTNAQSRNFEEAMTRRDIPYRVVGGLRYYDRKEIKDMVAYLRLVLNPNDEIAIDRVINVPKRGVGATTVTKLKNIAIAENRALFEVLSDMEIVDALATKTRAGINQFVDAITAFHDEKDNLKVSDIYDGLLMKSGYMKALEDENTLEADARIENLLEFKSVIYDFEKEDELPLHEFLEKIALVADVDNHDAEENAVTLMTMHSAKGLEFPFVFIPGMEDGLFPGWRSLDSPDGIEEERRLCYVGMTRAKERLCMTSANYRVLFGSGNFTRESQFMREINPKLLEGDGIYRKENEARLGSHKPAVGIGEGIPFTPVNKFKQAKRVIKQKAQKIDLIEGDRISHGKFGAGTVIEAKGNVARIEFDNGEIKKLATDVAPIKRI